jgi:F-type H+-transporting ATPase subunit delta
VRASELTAKRYAKALFMAAKEAGSTVEVVRELDGLEKAVTEHAGVRDVLGRPWIKGADRRAIATAIAASNGAGRLVQNFAGLVADRGRADHLVEIAAAYRALVDEDLGQVRAQVSSAVALSDANKRGLESRLQRVLGKRIILEERMDRTLLGGFIAQIGSLVLDASLDGQLATMRERLIRG